jgi:hypothetical protein
VVARNDVQAKASEVTHLTTARPKVGATVSGDSSVPSVKEVPREVEAVTDNIAAASAVGALPALVGGANADATLQAGDSPR